jgi:GNAT superfamily N-acetyltransferase
MGFAIAPLEKGHDRKQFSCGQSDLDDWFQRRASQDDKRNIARVFVATDDELGIVGFYSLSSFTLTIDNLPQEVGLKLPRDDAIPAALIDRLARDVRARGKGSGELLMADAVRRILGASRTLAVFAIVVEAKDATASAFYEGFGFRPFPLRPQRLFLLASTAAAAFERI